MDDDDLSVSRDELGPNADEGFRTRILEAVVPGEALGGALVLSACVIVLAELGLTSGLQWIPEVPLLTAAVLLSAYVE